MTETRPPGTFVRTFVRQAWILLTFQLIAAAAAVAVTAWAAAQVRPLLVQRDELRTAVLETQKQIAESERRMAELNEREIAATSRIRSLEAREAELSTRLQGSRATARPLTDAINAFHRKDYAGAILKYDEALRLDPENAYIHNLKSYSQFRAGDVAGAARTMSRALQLDPQHDWGYFNLARYQCAAGSTSDALSTITNGLEKRGPRFRSWIEFFLTKDGEFTRLCRAIVPSLKSLK